MRFKKYQKIQNMYIFGEKVIIKHIKIYEYNKAESLSERILNFQKKYNICSLEQSIKKRFKIRMLSRYEKKELRYGIFEKDIEILPLFKEDLEELKHKTEKSFVKNKNIWEYFFDINCCTNNLNYYIEEIINALMSYTVEKIRKY